MVIITLQRTVDEKISFLKEQINPHNKPELNSTFQIQIDVIRSAAQDLENVEATLLAKEHYFNHLSFVLSIFRAPAAKHDGTGKDGPIASTQ
jgi:hypothetical protein